MLVVFVGRYTFCVYSMCMRATIVYIYVCDCIGIFGCEAHFNVIIVPASVCVGLRSDGGLYLFHSQEGFHGGAGTGQSPWAVCSLDAGPSPVQSRGGVLFDDLGTVAPGFGLPLGQGQPRWLCGHLRGVAGGEAL